MRRRDLLALFPAALAAAPAGQPLPQFPSLAHQLVWRNWDLVPAVRIARALGAPLRQVRATAAQMGLGAQQLDPATARRQRFQVLRRNWSFVPLDQLTTLVAMSPAEITALLAEDAFYQGHLGPKPSVPRVALDPAARPPAFDCRIRGAASPRPRFAFDADFARDTPPAAPPPAEPALAPRIGFPYPAPYGNVLDDPAFDSYYPDSALRALARQGLDGLWLHGLLRDLTTHPLLPGAEAAAAERIARLNRLIASAAGFGLDVYLYLNEPRAMPTEFFASHAELRGDVGRPGDGLTALCTSVEAVRQWLQDATRQLLERAPQLRGLILITASENLTNCYSLRRQTGCPRCRERSPQAVIGEVVRLIRDGARAAAPRTRIHAWDWSWGVVEDDPQRGVIAALPDDVTLQVDFERGTPVERLGRPTLVDEYSLSIPGPSPRAERHIVQGRERGLAVLAKVQIGNSWELSLLPFVPVPDLIAAKCAALRHSGVDGAMLSWTLGTWPSPNWMVAREFYAGPIPEPQAVLARVAAARYGPDHAAAARRAWTLFSNAFAAYPYSNTLVYSSVVQAGPAHPLWLTPSGESPRILHSFDSLRWTQPYGPAAVAAAFRQMAAAWREGVEAFAPVAAAAGPRAEADQRIHRAGALYWESIANQIEFHSLRGQSGERARLRQLVAAELRIAEAFLPLCEADPRIGFEASLQYFYLPQDVREKILWCRAVLAGPLRD